MSAHPAVVLEAVHARFVVVVAAFVVGVVIEKLSLAAALPLLLLPFECSRWK